jgi:hypothetical protein
MQLAYPLPAPDHACRDGVVINEHFDVTNLAAGPVFRLSTVDSDETIKVRGSDRQQQHCGVGTHLGVDA